ncbi:MAG: hypothetical protein CME36_11250 [unclassified Hahellaceae]|nr:hypothetical protein [Hahellaceae bacterium]|tara:strand:- start:52801 stop:53238 length:438 start_codon:yes stop_codon:yes gene_type:complete
MDKTILIREYFDDFQEAFASFDGSRVAAKFSLPFMAKSLDGSCTIFDTRDRLSAYFQAFLDEYGSKGCHECRYSELDLNWLGLESALATVSWSLLGDSGEPVMAWTESYLLSIVEDLVLAFATIDHKAGNDTPGYVYTDEKQVQE